MVMTAASLAPMLVEAHCPQVLVECPGGKVKSCSGTQVGDKCEYSHSCMSCGGSEIAIDEPVQGINN
jgi:hypothetical protein